MNRSRPKRGLHGAASYGKNLPRLAPTDAIEALQPLTGALLAALTPLTGLMPLTIHSALTRQWSENTAISAARADMYVRQSVDTFSEMSTLCHMPALDRELKRDRRPFQY